MNILILAAVAALTAQADAPPSAAQITTARRVLDETMLDFPSARFRDVHGNSLVICGFVNAKNRLGAYTGWKRFGVWIGEDPEVYSDEDGETADIMLDTLCGDDGRKLSGPDYSDRLTHHN